MQAPGWKRCILIHSWQECRLIQKSEFNWEYSDHNVTHHSYTEFSLKAPKCLSHRIYTVIAPLFRSQKIETFQIPMNRYKGSKMTIMNLVFKWIAIKKTLSEWLMRKKKNSPWLLSWTNPCTWRWLPVTKDGVSKDAAPEQWRKVGNMGDLVYHWLHRPVMGCSRGLDRACGSGKLQVWECVPLV